ncbi:hypothetical protein BC834DRAFT_868729 [Gloeopeniophorella convolvens]|nr:hypothetical protein BC834DRAFT_868729 [Gloeopeniophorella convolvens]
MAHLTSSLFHKPPPIDFGRSNQLPTPPETDSTDFLASGHPTLASLSAAGPAEVDAHNSSSMAAPVRRVSTLSYHNSPLRDPRDRGNPRQSRWLVVIIPPGTLTHEHGPLGHTLASGPSQRLSQGILMPLMPTMYSQLTAIAREFNFPSPVGLCLYLQVVEHGFTMAPRISDEIWPALGVTSSPPQTPICGRIEFDIDRRKARWLDAWLTADRRHAVDVPVSVPPSLSHWREDSKTSIPDDRGDDRSEILQAPLAGSRPHGSRHIPRKLSLVDKFETLSVASGPVHVMVGAAGEAPNSLAPISQEEEPQTAKIDLEHRVKSWRASSSVAPTPMAAAGQVSLDPVHIPNHVQLSDIELPADVDEAEELNLDDFAWSVSSAGPFDYDPLDSAVSWSQVTSVHLDRRLGGSVLLSPSTATSWGPESLAFSPVSTQFRLPSPDLGQRLIEDCPPTPSTATSWGPEELAYSPMSVSFRLPSPDLGLRMLDDSPLTSNDISESVSRKMGLESGDWTAPLSEPGSHVFPYFLAETREAWNLVWPFRETNVSANAASVQLRKSYPAVDIYDTVYPHFEIYPGHVCVAEEQGAPITVGLSAKYPAISLYPITYPAFEIYPGNVYLEHRHVEGVSVRLGSSYPALSIYPTVYPHLQIYPQLPAESGAVRDAGKSDSENNLGPIKLGAHYPTFDLYPAGYPANLEHIYPPVALTEPALESLSVHLPATYPGIDIYTSVYPFVTPYPPCIVSKDASANVDSVDSKPPITGRLYLSGQPPFYPVFTIYPAVQVDFESKDPTAPSPDKAQPLVTHLPAAYPYISIYPPVYPEFDLYPMVPRDDEKTNVRGALSSSYPRLRLYPVVYPFFEIYPGHVSDGESTAGIRPKSPLQPVYPRFDIYPAVYPYFDIYRTGLAHKESERIASLVSASIRYPALSIYPPVYPYFDLYPAVLRNHLVIERQLVTVQAVPLPDPRSEVVDATLAPPSAARRPSRSHKELHEAVFGPELSLDMDQVAPLQPAFPIRSRTRSGTVIASPRVATPPSGSLPPLPTLRTSPIDGTLRAGARQSGLPAHPAVNRSPLTARPASSYVASHVHLSPTEENRLTRSNSIASIGASPRREHGHHKPAPRPRDSLVLEKARQFDQLNTLPHEDQLPSTLSGTLAEFPLPPVPPVPQLPTGVPRPHKLDHSKYPFA